MQCLVRYKFVLISLLALNLTNCGSETDGPLTAAEVFDSCAGEALAVFDLAEIAYPDADSNGYFGIEANAGEALRSSFTALANGDFELALEEAVAAGYQLCLDPAANIVRFTPQDEERGRGLMAVRLAEDSRGLIIGVPHAVFEYGTLEEAVEIFQTASARALIVSATHRCANQAESGCDGSTGTCSSSSAPYRESDMAHNPVSAFQIAHEALYSAHPESWVINIHGMSGAGVSISNGTTNDATADSPVAVIWAALADAFPDETITSCNPFDGAAVDLRLCGTTNTQGRFVNGSANPCTQAAETASGHFLHLEQSLVVRGQADVVASIFQAAAP